MNKFKKIGLVLVVFIVFLFLLISRVGKSSQGLVVIDPGHGGEDPGTIGVSGLYEKDINLAVAKKLNRKLRLKGYRTLMTRDEDIYIEPGARAEMANQAGAKLLISLHGNALENNSQISGVQVLHYPDSNIGLAQSIRDSLVEKAGARDMGLVPRPDLIVLNQTRMPAVLVELGFLSNPQEEALLGESSYQNKLAQALGQAIAGELDKRK